MAHGETTPRIDKVNPKTTAIIQARMGSSRLPGKVLKTLCGKSVLEHVISRVRKCPEVEDTCVATTTSAIDITVVKECERLGIAYYCGSEQDVLSRYYEAAQLFKSGVIIRITADCPLIDPSVLSLMLKMFRSPQNSDVPMDYLSNTMIRSFPRGLDAEIFTFQALKDAYEKATLPSEREHVTPYIYNHPEMFRIKNLLNQQDLSKYRWTVDTPEDFELISKIYNALYPSNEFFTTEQVVEYLKTNPDLMQINAHIQQKKDGTHSGDFNYA